MDIVSDAPLPITLTVLALVDGLSIGTLLIPVFLLLAPGRVRGERVLLYLVTIAGFYLAVGVLFTLGLVNLVDVAQDVLSSTPGQVLQLVVGGGLLVTAIVMGAGGSKKAETRAEGTGRSGELSSASAGGTATAPVRSARLARWRDRLLSRDASPGAVMAVAVGAGVIEVATMLPYLVAMGMLAEAPLGMPVRFAALAAYCAVMVLPALVLLALRIVAAPLVARPLARLAAWMERTGRENTAWIIGIVGFFIARAAANELGLFDGLAQLG
ncbi:GAP family protein [Microbacterium lushaniae]|uniref:Sap, sulfolipid-1-addressing protein n=1 Tax=Microbacterium lushaniae TaxID=2614639 RepID=A0A5J6L4Y7_9MICO|nr:GAP family protein [Microbacterium lushaniae]QEW03614.1 hypothetical protein F6J85_11250 [Microbacterium lushaniae]